MPVCDACLKGPEPLTAEFFCRLCQTPFQNAFPLDDAGLCTACRNSVRGFDAAYCFGDYQGNLRKLVHLFKYSRFQPLYKPLSRMLLRALPRTERFDAVVCVPMHWRKKWQRGFNQAELLARETARRTGAQYVPALKRAKAREAQASLTDAQRRTNVAGAFRVKDTADVRGKRVLLIDDVMTTGATADACGAALRRAGATSVVLLTLARVDRRLTGGADE